MKVARDSFQLFTLFLLYNQIYCCYYYYYYYYYRCVFLSCDLAARAWLFFSDLVFLFPLFKKEKEKKLFVR